MRLVISFDPAKDVLNQEKHGTSLSEAEHLVWEEALMSEDRRKAYGEKRMIAIAPMGRRLFVAIYTDRGSYRRIISLRKANDREIKAYIAHF
ncbi:MAG: BrnT family toxin [Alphaproteobacteria bacterium]|nr:BrnT family toxin [Beijerinckiaceae bacterium]NBQ38442.1 BrnT family toxin [Alphaproteobacteria bacterium]